MKTKILIVGFMAFGLLRPVAAQLAPPNEQGVSMGHLHLVVQDVDAAKNFWMAFGGVPAARGAGIKFPGVIILLRKGEPMGGSVGSVTNHVGFAVPNVLAAAAKWKSVGLTTEAGRDDHQCWLTTPDGLLRIEILEESGMTVPLKFQHIHFWAQANPVAGGPGGIKEMQAWYAKVFGGVPGTRGANISDDVPGVNLTFTKTDTMSAPTKGRMLDHIGFEIKGLEDFCKRESAQGIVFDRPCAKPADKPGFNMYLTDPWGTYIELTEGLSGM
jgi:hypothetical protein